MRVIAGTAKGRRLNAPPGTGTRPTGDRVREALFSVLQPRLLDASVLDLFAGSGALGIEALSRGAAHATFVEKDAKARQVVTANLQACGFADRATVLGGDAATLVKRGIGGAPFDVVLLDPPYAVDRKWLGELLADLVPHLAAGAVITLELALRGDAPRWPEGALAQVPRRYGDTVIHVADVAGHDAQDPAGDAPS